MNNSRLTSVEYERLIPLKPIWETFKKNQTLSGLQEKTKVLSDIFTRLHGYRPDNSCGGCIIDTFVTVMNNFDEYELLLKANIPIVVEKSVDEVFEIMKKEIRPKRKRINEK